MASTRRRSDYDEGYYAAREGWRDRYVESAAAVAHLRGLPGPLVLDVGCGSGPLFPLLHAQGLTPVGVETNLQAAQLAARRPGAVAVQVGSDPAMPFRAAVAGGIVAQHVIEHLDQPAEAVREWRRVLQPGGRLVVLTPNLDHPDGALFADPDHRTLFTARSLVALLDSAGCRVIEQQGLFPYLGRTRAGRALSRRAWRWARRGPWRPRARTLLIVAERAR